MRGQADEAALVLCRNESDEVGEGWDDMNIRSIGILYLLLIYIMIHE